MSVLVDAQFKVRKGDKGRLINAQDNPRPKVECDYDKDFENCMGGPDNELHQPMSWTRKLHQPMSVSTSSTLVIRIKRLWRMDSSRR
jgi:hypothetical protein